MQLRRKLNVGLAGALFVLATVSGYSLLNLGALARTDGWVYRTQETRSLVRSTLASLTDAESSERAYILTSDTAYLGAFNRAIIAVDSHVIALEAIEGDDVLEQNTVRRVAPMMAERIALMHAAVDARRLHGESVAASMLPLDRGVRDSLRNALTALDRAELAQLGPRQERSERQARRAMAVVIAGTLVATMLAVVLGLMLRRDSLGRQKSEALYQGMINVLGEGILVRDPEGRIVECNPSAERILGLTRAQLLGMRQTEIACYAEDGTPLPAELHPGSAVDRPSHGGSGRSDVVGIRRPDGEMRWILVNASPMLIPGTTRIMGVTTSFLDITRRQQAEASVSEQREQLHDFLENAGELILIANADGRILYANRAICSTLGYANAEELQGKLVSSIIDPGNLAEHRARMEHLCAGERLGEYTQTFIARSGRRIDVSGNVTCKFENGLPVMLRGIFRDMTEINAAQEQLMLAIEQASAASRAKSEFLANMSHELRTPLNSVIGFASVLMRNKKNNLAPQDLQYLERIHDNGRHLLGLINSVLDLSKVEAGRMDLDLGPVDLDALVHETLGQMEGQLQNRPVTLRAVVPEGLAPLTTDAGKLKQVLINLVGNALKFTEQGSVTVRVVANAARQPVSIQVVDTGIGIPAERQAAVFEAFQQADNSTARRFGGTGLGLTITRSICQLLGFGIALESEPGRGTTFALTMQPARSSGAHAAMDPAAFGDAPRVLIIDDDPDARLLLAQYVQDAGCEAITIGTGAQGLRLAAERKPALILLDLMMPQMNGFEVLERLRGDADLKHIPVVVVSIVASEHRKRAIGAAALIDKPVQREEIEQVLRDYLDHPVPDAGEQISELIRQTLAAGIVA